MKKGVVLVIVMGIMFFVLSLALVASYLMTQQARISEHKIRRTRTFFAARAGMVRALDELRNGACYDGDGPAVIPDTPCNSGKPYHFTIGATIPGYAGGIAGTYTWTDDNSGPNGSDPVVIDIP